MKILTIWTQKGGVGKTALACQLAHVLRARSYRVLVVDLDSQGNAGASLLRAERAAPLEITAASLLMSGNLVTVVPDVAFAVTPADALSFVQSVALPAPHRPPQFFSGPLQFEDGKEQLFTVGANAVAFESGVPGHLRSVITNSLLLAQLAAQQQGVNAYDEDQTKWLKACGQVLSNMGWQVTEVTDSRSVDNESGVDVHDAIISLVNAVIKAAGGGLLAAGEPLIKTALESLDKMDASSPWITLYKDTSQSTQTASFQLTLAQPDQNAEVTVSALAFVFIATKEIKQILFFKRSMAEATLKYRGSKATINPEALGDDIQGELEKRLAKYITSYISAVALPNPPPTSKET